MKIAFVSTMNGSPWGGSEELWFAAASVSLARKHTCLISTFAWPQQPAQLAELHAHGASLQSRPRRPSRIAGWFTEPAWLGELAAFKPDVVCISQGSAYECVARRPTRPLLRWLERTRTPMVNIVQFNSPSAGRKASTVALARRFYDHAAANLFVAARNIDEVAAYLGQPVPRAAVTRNPVNLADTSPLPWPDDSTLRLACVARLSAWPKGQDMLLNILARPAWKNRNWRLTLAGTGPDEAAYRELATTLGLTDRIDFPGQVRDMRALWSSHHALVLPSLAEGTPLAMVEAMLLARPVIVTDVGGCADWVNDGLNGWLAQPDTESIAITLERAWQLHRSWREIGDAARATALKLWDPNPGLTISNTLESAATIRP